MLSTMTLRSGAALHERLCGRQSFKLLESHVITLHLSAHHQEFANVSKSTDTVSHARPHFSQNPYSNHLINLYGSVSITDGAL
jgi:hypothetical protein